MKLKRGAHPQHWLGQGAQPTDRVARFLEAAGHLPKTAPCQPQEGRAGQGRAGPRRQEGRPRQRRVSTCAAARFGLAEPGGQSTPRAPPSITYRPNQGRPPMAPDLVVVGAIAGAFGVRGDLRIKSFCADPAAIAGYGPLTAANGRVFDRLTLTGATTGALVAG